MKLLAWREGLVQDLGAYAEQGASNPEQKNFLMEKYGNYIRVIPTLEADEGVEGALLAAEVSVTCKLAQDAVKYLANPTDGDSKEWIRLKRLLDAPPRKAVKL